VLEAQNRRIPRASSGDVNPDGDVVGLITRELHGRLALADATIDLEAHLRCIASEVVRARRTAR